jgi:tellurite resistance protein
MDKPAPRRPALVAHLPPTLFGAVMGISGLGLAWRRAEMVHEAPSWPGDVVLLTGALVLAVLLPAYGFKFLRHREAVAQDLGHPVKGPFLAGMPLALLLQVPALAPFSLAAAQVLFVVGAAGSLAINLYIFARWFLGRHEIEQFNAIWLIPGVGSFIVAITGAPVGFKETAWFFFAVGLGFWLSLSAILIYRYIFFAKHADPLVPSYFVPIVPPGLMSMIYPMLVAGELAGFTRVIYYFALFLLILSLAMFREFLRLKFTIGWWAYSFPFDTITSATILFAQAAGLAALAMAGKFMLAATTAAITYLFVRTVVEIWRGGVFVADPKPA